MTRVSSGRVAGVHVWDGAERTASPERECCIAGHGRSRRCLAAFLRMKGSSTLHPMAKRPTRWKQQWKKFAAQEPGRRFRDRYERRREAGSSRPWWRKALNLGGGVVMLAVGAFFAVVPGPAIPFFAFGGLLLANESRFAARVLDAIDLFLAPIMAWIQRQWKKLSPTARRVSKGCMVAGSILALVAGVWIMR